MTETLSHDAETGGHVVLEYAGGPPVQPAPLARVDPDGSVTVVAQDLHFANAALITRDGRTLLVNETFGNRISAFDILPDGMPGPHRAWATLATCRRDRTWSRSFRN